MRRPIASAAITLLASAGIAFAAAPAFAATTAPVPGTQRCVEAVNNDATVQADVTALNTARTTLLTDQANGAPAATVAAHQTAVDNAANALAVARTNATNALCTGTADPVVTPAPVGTPATQVPGATSTTTAPTTPRTTLTVAQVDAEIDALNCGSPATAVEHIDTAIKARQDAGLGVAESIDRLNAKLANLHCTAGAVTPQAAAQTAKGCGCAGVVTQAPAVVAGTVTGSVVPRVVTTETVSPTASDGSTATLSGHEVVSAPVGSASTGAE